MHKHFALFIGCIVLFYRISLQGKANTNFKDKVGTTPLHLACHEAYFDMAKLLIQNGQYIIK